MTAQILKWFSLIMVVISIAFIGIFLFYGTWLHVITWSLLLAANTLNYFSIKRHIAATEDINARIEQLKEWK